MTPGASSAAGKELIVEHPAGGTRYPAQLFDLKDGIVWIEYGWAEDNPLSRPSNPVHGAEGKVTQTHDGQWAIASEDGTVYVRALDEQKDRALLQELQRFNRGDRERAREVITNDVSVSIQGQ